MFLGTINLVIIFGIIVFGLWPFNFWPKNQVDWLEGQNGVHFYGRGIIFGEAPTPSSLHPFSLEICLQPEKESYDYTARILSLHDGRRTEKVVLSQWKSGLIIQKRIQHRPEESYPKVGIRNALPKGEKRFLTLTSGPDGTKVYIDGKLAGKYPGFHLSADNDSSFGRIVLGNSPRGTQPWHGNLYSLAVYGHSLTEEQVFRHYQGSVKKEGPPVEKGGLFALYLFDEHSGARANDGAGRNPLLIPSGFEVLQKTILVPPWEDFRWTLSYMKDVMTNILGFVPFGFFLSAYLRARTPSAIYRLLLISLLFTGFLGVSIELIQAHLPTRSSQLMDVIMNMLGAALGTVLFHKIVK
ncbi:MAG: hypothetical protein EHM36_04660 [Deltaproteobacteria bacterium]|nr:MAG: hypothetical protein EHM36_04660 [Deltaproteobacteria bacterium]